MNDMTGSLAGTLNVSFTFSNTTAIISDRELCIFIVVVLTKTENLYRRASNGLG